MTNITKKFAFGAIAAVVSLWSFSVLAQSPEPASPSAAPLDPARQICADRYRFGSVVFTFDKESQNALVVPGERLKIAGTVKNENEYPLPDGQIVVRVLRQDAKTEQRDWHPVIADFALEGMALKAGENKEFTFEWPIPAMAPAGKYRAEVFYQAAERFSMAGLPFVANSTAGSVLFTVKSAGLESALNFDRSSVLLNGKALSLRSVPPALSKDKPVTISAKLKLENNTKKDVTFKLTKKLFNWSDADPGQPVTESEETVTLSPGKVLPVVFQWDKPEEGVYQVQFSALPDSPHVLPSQLKVRFPVGGDSPRIIYSGLGQKFDGMSESEIVTCALNGTFGEAKGTVTTQVKKDGQVIAEKSEAIPGSGVAATVIPINTKDLLKGFSVFVKTVNGSGKETDSHTISYSPEVLGFAAEQNAPTQSAPQKAASVNVYLILVFLSAALIALAALLFVLIKKRTKKNINDQITL